MRYTSSILTLCISLLSATSIAAMDSTDSKDVGRNEAVSSSAGKLPTKRLPNLLRDVERYMPLTAEEKEKIECLRKDYYSYPSVFKLEVTSDAETVRKHFPIKVTFLTDYQGLKPIAFEEALSHLPQMKRLPGHENLRLPCSWGIPEKVHLRYTEQGWASVEWKNLFDGHHVTVDSVMPEVNVSMVMQKIPLALYFCVAEPATTEVAIRFISNNGLVYDYPFFHTHLKGSQFTYMDPHTKREIETIDTTYSIDLRDASWTSPEKSENVSVNMNP